MIKLFNSTLADAPICFLDTETTGIVPGVDKAVEVALVRFEKGVAVGEFSARVNPGRPIPAEATAIHGITDEMVAGAPDIEEVFKLATVLELLKDAQPGAYHGSFDRQFVPVFTDPADWPWVDPLVIIRDVDKFCPGKGRHRLDVTCARHGIELLKAHSASSDARAAGLLFFKLIKAFPPDRTVGEFLRNMQQKEALQWFDHMEWRAKQPPIPAEERGAA